jgi:hypothetical protein
VRLKVQFCHSDFYFGLCLGLILSSLLMAMPYRGNLPSKTSIERFRVAEREGTARLSKELFSSAYGNMAAVIHMTTLRADHVTPM